MNCQLLFLKEQVMKLFKIQSVPPSYLNAKNDVLKPHCMVTDINVLSQLQTASLSRFPSCMVRSRVLSRPWKVAMGDRFRL